MQKIHSSDLILILQEMQATYDKLRTLAGYACDDPAIVDVLSAQKNVQRQLVEIIKTR